MAKSSGKRISGIYIPIELDTSQYMDDLRGMRNELQSVLATVQSSFNKSLDTSKLTNNLVNIQKSFGQIRDGAKALDTIKLGGLDSALAQLNPQLTKVSQSLGISAEAQSRFLKAAANTQAINQQVTALNQLKNVTGLTAKEFDKLIKSANMNVSAEAMTKFSQQMQQRQQRNIITSAFTPTNISAGLQSGAAAFGVVGGAYGLAEFTKSSYNATRQMENLRLSFESIFGSSDEAATHIDYVRQMTDTLGLSFIETSAGAKKLFAAAQGTELEEEATGIFEAFSTMSAALKLSGSETESVFLAISQMISKGKVSAEELRLQLSERMPGAVNLFAKSIGVSTKALDEMLQKGEVGLEHLVAFSEEVQRTYEKGAVNAASGVQAEIERLGNAWFNLKRNMVDSDWTAELARNLTMMVEGFVKLQPAILSVVTTGFQLGTAFAGLYVLGKLPAIIKGISTSVAGLIGTINPLSAIIGITSFALFEMITHQSEADELFESLAVTSSKFTEELAKTAAQSEEAVKSLEKLRSLQADTTLKLKIEGIDELLSVEQGDATRSYIRKTFLEAVDTEWFAPVLNKLKLEVAHGAADIGEVFLENIKAAAEGGASAEQFQVFIDQYVVGMAELYESLAGSVDDPAILKSFDDVRGKILTMAAEVIQASGDFELFDGVISNVGKNSNLGIVEEELTAVQKALQEISSKAFREQEATLRKAEEIMYKARESFKEFQEEQIAASGRLFSGTDQPELDTIIAKYDKLRETLEELAFDGRIAPEQYESMAKLLDANQQYESIPISYNIDDQMNYQLSEFYNEFENRARLSAEIIVDSYKEMSNAVGDFFASGLQDIDSFEDAVKDMANNFITNVSRMLSNQLFSGLGNILTNAGASSQGGEGGILNSIMSGLGSIFGFADGAAFSGPSGLGAYSGSVVTSPTYFSYGSSAKKFARGGAFLGQMGEAGAEAIMPLTRTSSGKLGVRAEGGGSPVVVENNQSFAVNIVNNTDSQVSTQESTDQNGNMKLDVMIDRQVSKSLAKPGTSTYKTMQNRYGAREKLVKR